MMRNAKQLIVFVEQAIIDAPRIDANAGDLVRIELACRLEAARNRLPVVIAECAGYAGGESCLFRGVQHAKQSHLEIVIHAADYVSELVRGAAQLNVKTATAADVTPVYDAVILTCKAYDLGAAIAAITPALAPHGYVLPFLNGIAHIDVLNEKFGRHRVLGGTAKIQATIMPDGAIRQFNDWRTLTFGEQSGEMTVRVNALAALFEATKGVEAIAVTDIVQRMWEKLVHLSTAAAMTCLMRANVGEIVRTPYGRELFMDPKFLQA